MEGLLIVGLLSALSLYGAPVEAQHDGLFRAGDDAMVTHNIMVPMRDGTLLSTDIYVPAGGGRYPAILIRDPYDNGSGAESVGRGAQVGEARLRVRPPKRSGAVRL